MYERLQKICAEKNITVSKLCERVTGSSGNLATWKKGYMRSDYLSKCADILGCTTDHLLGRDTPGQIIFEKTITFPQNVKSLASGNIKPMTARNLLYDDEMTLELVKRFEKLSFEKKLEVLNLVVKLSENKKIPSQKI